MGKTMTPSGFEEGSVSLHVAVPAVLDVEMTSMAPSPPSVEVSAAPAVVNLVFTMNPPAGFQSGVCWIYGPNGLILPTVEVRASHRTSGNNLSGTYSVPVTIPRYASPGLFKVEVDVTDAADKSANYSNGTVAWADHVLPAPAGSFTINVTNGGTVDTAPPTLVSISIAPTPVNVGSGSGTTYVYLRITDPLAGVGQSSISVFDPSSQDPFQGIHFHDLERISGDAHDGGYRVPITLTDGVPTGLWSVQVGLLDQLGNFAFYYPVNMPGGPSAAEFEVISSAGGTYDDWALTYFTPEQLLTIGAFDADGDGVPNGIESVDGRPPTRRRLRSADGGRSILRRRFPSGHPFQPGRECA